VWLVSKMHVQNEDSFVIGFEFINGQQIYTNGSFLYLIQPAQLKTDNLRVKFKCEDSYPRKPSDLVFFKSCGFHLQQLYEEKAIALMDGI
jgi:hypothetical protein